MGNHAGEDLQQGEDCKFEELRQRIVNALSTAQ